MLTVDSVQESKQSNNSINDLQTIVVANPKFNCHIMITFNGEIRVAFVSNKTTLIYGKDAKIHILRSGKDFAFQEGNPEFYNNLEKIISVLDSSLKYAETKERKDRIFFCLRDLKIIKMRREVAIDNLKTKLIYKNIIDKFKKEGIKFSLIEGATETLHSIKIEDKLNEKEAKKVEEIVNREFKEIGVEPKIIKTKTNGKYNIIIIAY